MDYAQSLERVLLRKIQKAEQELLQLKLDYCRFVFNLTHRSKVAVGGKVFQVRAVDVDSMKHLPDGGFSRPELTGVPVEPANASEPVELGNDWALAETTSPAS